MINNTDNTRRISLILSVYSKKLRIFNILKGTVILRAMFYVKKQLGRNLIWDNTFFENKYL